MQIRTIYPVLLIGLLTATACRPKELLTQDIGGEWLLVLDSLDRGVHERFYAAPLEHAQSIELPSTLDEQAFGKKVKAQAVLNKETLYQLTRKHRYVGAAWYQREITIPPAWKDRPIYLEMERVIWKSQVWVDGHYKGTDNSLVTAHEISLGKLSPGKHLITICIDNRQQHDIFDNSRAHDLTHAYTETTQIKWNGILGDFKLRAAADYQINDLQIYPDVSTSSITVKMNGQGSGELRFLIKDAEENVVCDERQAALPTVERKMTAAFKKWDEFNPHVYQFVVKNGKGRTIYSTSFGMRHLERKGKDMFLNGKRIFLRGTLECCIFPLTGHPPMDEKGWEKVFKTAKNYGLNHLRFHSWCPPKAAFEVADKEGFYLQVEMPNWSLKYGENKDMVQWMEAEGRRIIEKYGNHPSFCMMALGNELEGDYTLLTDFVKTLQAADPRHLYTTTAFTFQKPHTSSPTEVDEYWITQWTKDGWVRGQGVFDTQTPAFDKDYRASITFLDIPLITHEIGQYSVYPNLKEIEKYTGVLSPLNFQAIKQDLEKKGRLEMANDYLQASGHLAEILYKEEIERALKTPGISGFQLLDLHDFPGQGTALVGLLDAFWDSKGITSGKEFRAFCSELVPLLKFEKAVYTNDEIFSGKAEVANYFQTLEEPEFTWQIKAGEHLLSEGTWTKAKIEVGTYAELGSLEFPLHDIKEALRIDVSIALKGSAYKNSWSIWVYPKEQKKAYKGIHLTSDWNHAEELLAQGKKVLFTPPLNSIKGIEGKFVPVFWSPVHFPKQPGTMGLLINPEHPAFHTFPTDFHSNWQWWDLCKKSKTLPVDSLSLSPLVRVVDNFFFNRRLCNLFEAKVGEGSLLFSGMDLHSHLQERPVASCLLSSLSEYMLSPAFSPTEQLEFHQLRTSLQKKDAQGEKQQGSIYD